MNTDRFKFRAWLSSEKRMIKKLVVEIDSNPSDKPIFRRYLCQCCGSDSLHDIDDCDIIMQSTGLRDKNGVLIFEGDIVIVIGETNNQGRFRNHFEKKAFAEWSDTNASFNIFYGLNESGELEINTIEVIGKIYEHPELLEKCND